MGSRTARGRGAGQASSWCRRSRWFREAKCTRGRRRKSALLAGRPCGPLPVWLSHSTSVLLLSQAFRLLSSRFLRVSSRQAVNRTSRRASTLEPSYTSTRSRICRLSRTSGELTSRRTPRLSLSPASTFLPRRLASCVILASGRRRSRLSLSSHTRSKWYLPGYKSSCLQNYQMLQPMN